MSLFGEKEEELIVFLTPCFLRWSKFNFVFKLCSTFNHNYKYSTLSEFLYLYVELLNFSRPRLFKSESLLSILLLRARNKLLSRIVFSLAHKNRLYSTRKKTEQFETFFGEGRARDLLSPARMGRSGLPPPPLCLAETDNNKNLRISRGRGQL